MATKNKIGLQIDLESMISSLEKAGKDSKVAIESVLIASKQMVTDALVRDTVKSNFPAGGKYSVGAIAESIDKGCAVKWQGLTSEIPVGYDFDKVGVESIVLLYGTPRMKKAQKLYNDIYGSKIKKQIKEVQQETLNKILEGAV